MSEILVVAEHRQGHIRPVTRELVGAAVPLKEALGLPLRVVVAGAGAAAHAAALALEGVDEVLSLETDCAEFTADAWRTALAAVLGERAPRLVLVPHSVDGYSYAPALAAELGLGFATDVFALRVEAQDTLVAVRAGYREKVHLELEFPGKHSVLLTVRPGTFPAAGPGPMPACSALSVPSPAPRSRHQSFLEPENTGDMDISAAEIILAVGRGAGDEAMVEELQELADAMGAALGCSRPVADAGWLPKSRQVGQSGRTATACKLYIALGISGAVQHLAGMKHVDSIIAVNEDPEAPIFGVAHYGVVADVAELGEALREHF